MGLTYPSNKICPRCGKRGYVWYFENLEYVKKCTNCGHYFRRERFPMCVLDEAPKPQTNADKIRNMTDEEMADEIFGLFAAFYEVEWSKETLLNWLKQEAI